MADIMTQGEKNLELLRKSIPKNERLWLWCIGPDGMVISTDCPEHEAFMSAFKAMDGLKRALERALDCNPRPLLIGTAVGMQWAAAFEPNEKGVTRHIYLIGPVFYRDISMREIHEGLELYANAGADLKWRSELIRVIGEAPVLSFAIFSRYAILLHNLLNSEQLSVTDLSGRDLPEGYIQAKKSEKPHDRHRVWQAETALLQMVKNGDIGYQEALAANFDTLKEASLFWVDNLVTDTRDGKLVSSPSWSPEHGPYSLGAYCDQAIIWDLFNNTLEAADILGIDDSEIDEIRAAFNKLSGPQIGKGGQFMEWKDEITLDVTGDYGHRHVNHLFALHPGRQIVAGRSKQDDKYAEAMKVTLITRGDGGTGWSKAWKINFWARLRDGNHAGTMVNQILKESTYDNLFDTHPPFQIDGNFGATAGMTEMLLQSQGGAVELLPALPDMWSTGSVSGLRARGNVEVGIEWKDGAIVTAVLKTFSDSDSLTVKAAGIKKALLIDSNGEAVKFRAVDGDTIEFSAKAGEVYTLFF